MQLSRIHHVAFAHDDGGVVDALGSVLELRCAHTEDGPGFVERMFPIGDGFVQTLEATGEGVVDRFVERRGAGLHHVAFAVDDIDAALAELRKQNVRLVDEQARDGGLGTRIAFLHPSSCGGLLVELVEGPD